MGKYLLKRVVQMLVVIVPVTVATFFLTDLVPGDVVYVVAGTEELDQAQYDAIYYSLGLDKPLAERFLSWAEGAVRFDFGKSYVYSKPVWEVIAPRLPITMYFSALAIVISVPIGVAFGMLTAIKRKTKTDTVITLIANALNCMPQFWIGIVLMYVLSLKLKLLPSFGFHWPWDGGLWLHIKGMIMPMTCLVLGGVAGFTRQTRSSMLEVVRQDFMRTARSKGLEDRRVYMKHMLRNGIIPVITVIGNRLAYSIGISMFVENVFSIPGLGSLAMKCIQCKDIPTIQAIVFITTIICCVVYIATDVIYVAVDPRISLTNAAD